MHTNAAQRSEADGDTCFEDCLEAIAGRKDRAAFALLFDHFAPRVKGFVLRLGVESGIAEEIAQDVMLTIWRKADTFERSKASAATWIYRIARNRRIDLARRVERGRLDENEPALQPEAETQPDDALAAKDRDERVRIAMRDLPEEQVDLLRRAFFDGLSHSEIADATGLPLGTVKSRLRLAFEKLRRSLEPD